MMARDRKAGPVSGRWMGAAALAGAMAWGVKCLMLALVALALGHSFWLPANLAGATLGAFTPPATGFEVGPTLTGLAIHVIFGALMGAIFGLALYNAAPRSLRTYGRTAVMGLGFGLVYQLLAIAVGPLFNAEMALINPLLGWGIVFASNLLFGVVTALLLKALLPQREVTISLEHAEVRERERVRE